MKKLLLILSASFLISCSAGKVVNARDITAEKIEANIIDAYNVKSKAKIAFEKLEETKDGNNNIQ